MINPSLFGPLVAASTAVLVGALTLTLTAYLWLRNRDRELRKDLSNRLEIHWTAEQRAIFDRIASRTVEAMVFETAARDEALTGFLGLQKIAGSVTDNPRLWDNALTHEDHELVRLALAKADPLFQVIRRTNVPVGRRVWNGHRTKAFNHLLKAFRMKLSDVE